MYGYCAPVLTLKFFVSSSFNHCSAAESRKLPLHPSQRVSEIIRVSYFAQHTFAFAMRHRLAGGTLRREEEQVHMRVDLRDDGVRDCMHRIRQRRLEELLQVPNVPLK